MILVIDAAVIPVTSGEIICLPNNPPIVNSPVLISETYTEFFAVMFLHAYYALK